MPEQTHIDPNACVHPDARLGTGVTVAAQAYIGPDVEVGDGCQIAPHAVLRGPMRLGRNNRIEPHACLGGPPQDIAWAGEPTRLEIGDDNVIGEYVSMHRASTKEDGVTRVGSGGFFMAYSHLAHDCQVGDGVVLANAANVGGHVHIGNRVNIAGTTAVHQFVRIGDHAMIGGGSVILKDVPPYMTATGNRAKLYGLNRRGLRRCGFPEDTIKALDRAYRTVFRSRLTLAEALEALSGQDSAEEVRLLAEFLKSSKRGVIR